MTIKKKIQLKRATAAEWATLNPVLSAGEAGVDLTNHKLKVGDGTTAYNSLPYVEGEIDLSNYYTKSQTYSKGEVESLLAGKVDVEDLATVATTGDYDDLSNKPVIPDVSTLATKTELADGLAGKQDAFEIDTPLALNSTKHSANLTVTDGNVSQIAQPAGDKGRFVQSQANTKDYYLSSTADVYTPSIENLSDFFAGGYVDIPLPATGSYSFMTGCRTRYSNFVLGKGYDNDFIPIAAFLPEYTGQGGLYLNMNDAYSLGATSYGKYLQLSSYPQLAQNNFDLDGGGGVSGLDLAVSIDKSNSSQYRIDYNFTPDGTAWYSKHSFVTTPSYISRLDEITTLRLFIYNTPAPSFTADKIGVYNYAGTFYAKSLEDLGTNLIDIKRLIEGTDHLQLSIGTGLAVQNGSLVNTLVDELYYKAGDTFTTSANLYCTGVLTAGAEGIRFTIPLPKCTSKVSSATIQKLVAAIRRPEGGYFYNSVDLVQNSNISNLRCTFPTPNQLSVYFEDSTITSSNNIVLSVQLANNGTQIAFS